jgi:PAS domain-containing protein
MSMAQRGVGSMPGPLDPFVNPRPPVEPDMFATGLDCRSDATGVGPVALSIFDQLSVGVILLDRSAKVLFANASAQSLSGKGEWLRTNADLNGIVEGQARGWTNWSGPCSMAVRLCPSSA